MKLLITVIIASLFTGEGVAIIGEPFVAVKVVKESECPDGVKGSRGELLRQITSRSIIVQWCENYEGASYESDTNSPDRDYDPL